MSSWNNNGWIVWILLNEKVKSPLMWLLFHWTGTGIGRGQAIWCGWHCANRLISVPCKKLNIPVCHILHLCLYTYMIGWTRLYYSHLLPMAIYKNVCIILLYSYYEHWTYIFFLSFCCFMATDDISVFHSQFSSALVCTKCKRHESDRQRYHSRTRNIWHKVWFHRHILLFIPFHPCSTIMRMSLLAVFFLCRLK